MDTSPGLDRTALVRFLAHRGAAVAVVTSTGQLTYVELAERVNAVVGVLGSTRRLVLLEGSNTVECLAAYLAALACRCPVLLVPPGDEGRMAEIVTAYDPDVMVRTRDGQLSVEEVRTHPAHELHADLALLLSTSGSSGSPKLVRLSRANLRANAEAIAEALGIRATDRAATTLPMHYCYGLSVINSHLLRGAALVLTDLSVVDACFWDLFGEARGTTFSGVPYTFDLLDAVGFDQMHLPHLRYVTQAGGRLAPERIRQYAELGVQRGWDLVVMYGQTEATARMGYLPPDLARSRPEAIGVAVPGGAFTLEPIDDAPGADVGELVYTGPNVMLGYATCAEDLGLGRTVEQLRTGDLARCGPDGLYEVVGRRSRFLKVFGLRIDQGHIESVLRDHGVVACCEASPAGLGVVVEGDRDRDPAPLRDLVARVTGLPPHAVQVRRLDRLPRLPSGKADHPAVRALLNAGDLPPRASTPVAGGSAADLHRLFADVLAVDVCEDDTFVSLGGDSLSYVEMSVRLEQALGRLPDRWHAMTVGSLARAAEPERRPSGRRRLDTGVALRAVGIVLIVGSHSRLVDLLGGAHLLMAVAGYNFARFHLSSADRRRRVRHLVRSIARIAVPAMVWIGLVALLTDRYGLASVLLVNDVFGPTVWSPQWSLWFLESLVQILLALTVLMSIPWLDRAERRFPFGFAAGLIGCGLMVRFDLVGLDTGPGGKYTPHAVFWLFALGWAVAKADRAWHRLALSGVCALTVVGWFGDPQREAVVVVGILLLVWSGQLPSTRLLSQVAGVLASSSLYIYVSHWQVYPHLRDRSPLLAFVASLAVGIAYWKLARRLGSGWRSRTTGRTRGGVPHLDRPATSLPRGWPGQWVACAHGSFANPDRWARPGRFFSSGTRFRHPRQVRSASR